MSAMNGTALSLIADTLKKQEYQAHLHGNPKTQIYNVQQDSRKVALGDLFVLRPSVSSTTSIPKLQEYTQQAIAQGAAAILKSIRVPFEIPIPILEISERDLRQAIGIAASMVHHNPSHDLQVLAVTGTNGKTTTTSLIGQAFDSIFHQPSCVTIGTLGARFGTQVKPTLHTTPEADEMSRLLAWARDNGARYAAIEASSHALDQRRLAGTQIRAAAFTNLTQDHLDYHGSMQAYFEAKCLLFNELNPTIKVVCIDDPYGLKLVQSFSSQWVQVSIHTTSTAEIHPLQVECNPSGIRAKIQTPWGNVDLISPLVGLHNLANILVSIGMLGSLKIPIYDITQAVGSVQAVHGRLEVVSNAHQDNITVFVDYAHTPDALYRALSTLRSLTQGALWCVFGCGGDRDISKRSQMGQIASELADKVVVTNDNPRTEDPESIITMIKSGIALTPFVSIQELADSSHGFWIEADRHQAIEQTIVAARPHDVVLIAGKGHEDYQIIGVHKFPFYDKTEAQNALKKRAISNR